ATDEVGLGIGGFHLRESLERMLRRPALTVVLALDGLLAVLVDVEGTCVEIERDDAALFLRQLFPHRLVRRDLRQDHERARSERADAAIVPAVGRLAEGDRGVLDRYELEPLRDPARHVGIDRDDSQVLKISGVTMHAAPPSTIHMVRGMAIAGLLAA